MRKLLSPKDIINSGLCIGCGSCVAQESSNAAKMQFNAFGELKPEKGSRFYSRKSASFTRTCPFSPAALNENQLAEMLYPHTNQISGTIGRFEKAYVGYAEEENFRFEGSSGGMVSWVAAELLRKGLIDGVAHVIATQNPQREGKYFRYRISNNEAEIREGAKSRYYPIELSQVLNTIRKTEGRYAVVGIPCFIKAVHLLRNEDPVLRERIKFTLGLFCGHMKSARFVESFAWQMNVPVREIQRVDFRYKYPNSPANWYNAALTLKDGRVVNKDWWHLADGDWGAGFFMNSACNFCDDVVAETADISFGDAWVEPYTSDGKGTNVIIVRTQLMQHLISDAIGEGRLKMKEVSGEFVTETQAAGFRQRRNGLAYRLTWNRSGVQPRKRVAPDSSIPRQRKVIYRMRYLVSVWSHRMSFLAHRLNMPKVYIKWARLAAAVYHGVTYHKGKPREIMKRFKELKKTEG